MLQGINPFDFDKISFRHGGAQEATNQLYTSIVRDIGKVQRIAHRWAGQSFSWRRYSDLPYAFKVKWSADLQRGTLGKSSAW